VTGWVFCAALAVVSFYLWTVWQAHRLVQRTASLRTDEEDLRRRSAALRTMEREMSEWEGRLKRWERMLADPWAEAGLPDSVMARVLNPKNPRGKA
jgi:hypothetical protein